MSTPLAAVEPLLSLTEGAARIGVTAASLKTEIKNGRLRPVIIAGKKYVTMSALSEMIERCRAAPKGPGSISEPKAGELPHGLSETDRQKLAQDAALKTVQALKKRSQTISSPNTSHNDVKAR